MRKENTTYTWWAIEVNAGDGWFLDSLDPRDSTCPELFKTRKKCLASIREWGEESQWVADTCKMRPAKVEIRKAEK